jgi:hypothetical protein
MANPFNRADFIVEGSQWGFDFDCQCIVTTVNLSNATARTLNHRP